MASGNSGNPPSSPDSPTTSAGFNTDQLPHNTSQNYTDDDDEAAVDPQILPEEPEEPEEEEEEGEDLFNDNFMESVY
jgi:DNA replication licensing factor MCM2